LNGGGGRRVTSTSETFHGNSDLLGSARTGSHSARKLQARAFFPAKLRLRFFVFASTCAGLPFLGESFPAFFTLATVRLLVLLRLGTVAQAAAALHSTPCLIRMHARERWINRRRGSEETEEPDSERVTEEQGGLLN
jgi:hypothetical protein